MRHTLTALLLLAVAALPASAATLKLRDGTTVNCKVQSYDTATKTLYVKLEDGRDARYTMSQLDGRSVYQLNYSLVPKGDARAQLLTANFARDAGLYAHAARRYKDAAKLDPKLEGTVAAEMAILRHRAAGMCADNARAAAAKKDYKEAEKWCKVLLEKLPGEPEAEQAAKALDDYYGQEREKKMAAADAKESAALKKEVEAGKARYAKMVDKSKQALQARGNAQAKGLYSAALVDGDYVLGEIDRIEKKYPDPDTKQRAAAYRKTVTEQMVEVHLNMASLLAMQSDYQGAQKEVNAALALDPKSEEALSTRVRLEDYSSRGLGWGLGW